MFIALCKSVIFLKSILDQLLFCNQYCCVHVKTTYMKTSAIFMFFKIIFSLSEFYVMHIPARVKMQRITFFNVNEFSLSF